jgi:hypothetical protein
MKKSTFSAILGVLMILLLTTDVSAASSSTFTIKCETVNFNLPNLYGWVQCAGCAEYEVTETMTNQCSSNYAALFDYSYKCISCVPGFSINQANSTQGHVYSGTPMGGATVNFVGDCIGGTNMANHALDPNYQDNNVYTQTLKCVNSVFTYVYYSGSSIISTADTNITCGQCKDLRLTRESINNTIYTNSGSTCYYYYQGSYLTAGFVNYTYSCDACQNGYQPNTQTGTKLNSRYGDVNIDLTTYCSPGSPSNQNGGEIRGNMANLIGKAVFMFAAIFAALN